MKITNVSLNKIRFLSGDCMEIPFDIIKQQDKELIKDMNRFMELSEKYKNDIDEVLEFANLCMRFYPIKRNKYKDV